MPTFVILASGPTAKPNTLTTKANYEAGKSKESYWLYNNDYVQEEFEANCWCEAMLFYNQYRKVAPYDMWACNDDFENLGEINCMYYLEMKGKLDELKD